MKKRMLLVLCSAVIAPTVWAQEGCEAKVSRKILRSLTNGECSKECCGEMCECVKRHGGVCPCGDGADRACKKAVCSEKDDGDPCGGACSTKASEAASKENGMRKKECAPQETE